MREYVWLECSACGERNYRVQKETRGANRLELKKYCSANGSTRQHARNTFGSNAAAAANGNYRRAEGDSRRATASSSRSIAGASGSTRLTKSPARNKRVPTASFAVCAVRSIENRRPEIGFGLREYTSVAQLVEHRSPKPAVGGSIPSARAVARRLGGGCGGARLDRGQPGAGIPGEDERKSDWLVRCRIERENQVPWVK